MAQVYLIGIGGSGMSAIARILIERGYSVSGSDLELSSFTRELQDLGAKVNIGHRPEQVFGAEEVVRSSAVPETNVEVQAALSAGIPIYKRSEYIAKLIGNRTGVAVAGTHGKTTTTAMISWVLTALKQDPSYIIGGVSRNLNNNAHAGTGPVFVIEADEYDYMFLGLRPNIAVITNIEHDHPDCFPTAEDFFQAFVDFAHQIPPNGILIVCADDDGCLRLSEMSREFDCQILTYGFVDNEKQVSPDYFCTDVSMNQQGEYHFNYFFDRDILGRVSLSVPGIHNVSNALATLAVAHQLGIPVEQTGHVLGDYLGTRRRFELRAEVAGIAIIDDYAHHPTEIRMTLGAARNRYPGRQLWAVWQPHTYSRTKSLFEDYLTAFQQADHVLVTEVFASREPVNTNFSSRQLVLSMDHPDVHFIANNGEVAEYLVNHLHAGDVLLVLSAGDAYQISEKVVDLLSVNGNKNYG